MASTIKDIQKRTGLGLATISKYLNGGNVRPENKKAIDDAVAALHFTVNTFARSMKTKRSYTIGVVIPELGNVFITSIITYVEDILRKQGYAVIVCDCRSDGEREKDVVRFLIQKHVDGILNMPTCPDGEHLKPALEAGVPVVLLDRMIRRLSGKVSAVLVDNEDAAHQAAAALLDAGHRDIGIILGPEQIFTTARRRAGYLEALEEHGLKARNDLILYSNYNLDGGYESMMKLMRLAQRPTAVFVTNYEMTIGAMIALNAAGLSVPGDVSFIGFDKQQLFQMVYPDMTVVVQPQDAIAASAARLVLAAVEEGDQFIPQTVTLTARLQAGKSVRSLAE